VVFDVSVRGAKVMSETGIKPGEHMTVSLTLPNEVSPTTVEEVAVRWGKEQTYGLEFINLSPIAEMRLRKFISIVVSNAQFRLGFMYQNGWGVPQDFVEAHKWYHLSATNGEKDGANSRDHLVGKMTSAQIAEAQCLAREWLSKNTAAGK
jgi:hypothetical protein